MTNPPTVRERWLGLSLIFITLLVYARVCHYEFINLDDQRYVTENPHVLGGFTAENLRWAFLSHEASGWQPLTWLSHIVDCELFGMNAGGHHVTNLLLHLASVVLLLRTLTNMTGALWPSALVAALFALHPLHVESVAWIAERKDVLSAFFWILTMWAYARYSERPTVSRYLATVLFFVCGLMSKPMIVSLPFILLALDYWPLGRIAAGTTMQAADQHREVPPRAGQPPLPAANSKSRGERGKILRSCVSFPRAIAEKVPFLFLAILCSLLTYWAKYSGGAVVPVRMFPIKSRIANALLSYARYIGKMIWPSQLAIYYPLSQAWPLWEIVAAGLFLVGFTALVFFLRRKKPYLIVGWFWYLATLVPVIGFIQVGGQAMADRFTYLPSIGPFIMVAWESRGWATKWQFAWPLTGFLCALLLFAYALVAFRQVGYWKDSITMFQHTLRVTGNNALAHFNLGCAYSAQQRTDEAIREYLEALRIDPRYAKAQYNLEAELAMRTAAERARSSQPTAARTQSELADAHSKLGFILLSEGKLPQAIQHFSEAANLEPMKATRHRDLGRTLALAGNSAAAVRHLEEALRLDPQFAEARRDLDELLKQTSIDKPAPQASPP